MKIANLGSGAGIKDDLAIFRKKLVWLKIGLSGKVYSYGVCQIATSEGKR